MENKNHSGYLFIDEAYEGEDYNEDYDWDYWKYYEKGSGLSYIF